MGCTFCFLTTRKNQSVRNLTGQEITIGISDVLKDGHFGSTADKDLLISFMSSGEPLNNLKGVMECIWDWAPGDDVRFGISSIIPSIRQGMELIKEIERLNEAATERLDKKVSVKLHYSLHATTDEKRQTLIPNATSISGGLSILDIYRKSTGNPVEIHFTPIAGVNDTDEDILRLADLANPSKNYPDGFHVKFLTFRAGANGELQPSDRVERMKEAIASSEIYNSPGADIAASCGMFEGR